MEKVDDREQRGTQRESEVTNDEVVPELTFALVGDSNSVEKENRNLLFDHDEQKSEKQISTKLYDLCGRHICVLNMLDLPNIDSIPSNQGVHAFILLVANGQHSSHYRSGMQWLEKTFGKQCFPYVITVVTHNPDENCENVIADLKTFSSFSEKRYQNSNRIMDENELAALLEKIDVMISENKHPCCSFLTTDMDEERKGEMEQKSLSEEGVTTDYFKVDTSGNTEEGDPVKKDDETENKKTNDNTVEQPEEPSVAGDADGKDSLNVDTIGNKGEGYPVKKDDEDELSKKTYNKTVEQPEETSAPVDPDDKDSLYVDNSGNKGQENNTIKGLISLSYPVKKDDGDGPSKKTESNTTEQPEVTPFPVNLDSKDSFKVDTNGNKEEGDPANKGDGAQNFKRTDDNRAGQPEETFAHIDADGKGFSDVARGGNTNEHPTNIPKENHQKKHQKEVESVFSRLQDRRQQKFSSTDFLKICPHLKQINDTPEKDAAQAFLQWLMALDYRARYIPVKPDSSEVNHLQSIAVSESVSTDDDDDFDAFIKTSVDSSQSKQDHVHPMDIQMVVFHCSDSFLKQNMITKLSQCQYALPLLVPDPAAADIESPLWTFRQIKKTWKKTEIRDNSKTVTIKSLPICKAETPLVSFFRLGSLSQSKSQLMNTLINDRHNTFFHRNCPRSTKSRHLMDGVVEIAWYCPAGKDNDSFSDCIGFCNLHGDSLLMEKQREILTEISSVLVVLVPALEKGQESSKVISTLIRSPNPLIVLTADNDCGAVQIKPTKYKVGLKDRSQSDVSKELREITRKILSGSNKSFNLELMSNISGVRVDEDDTVCQNGKSAAMNIVELIQDMDVSRIKDTFLPCQGQLWHEWCRTNKERFHLRGNIEKEKSQKDQQLIQIRQKQCAASCSELMKSFTDSLMSLEQKDKEYFLKWTQILIDELSSKDLSTILQNYDEKWSEVLTLKKKHDKSDQLKVKQTELEQISQTLQAATFGLEHIFREMSQIYEAHQSLKRQTHCRHTEWVKYPELAADLMISGHPMELMDGDAGHVPLTWISGLLQEVIKKLGDQRVFVLSVLGVQSSGKSTMLNAMFGLQFAVSAGRCTKGAYMQLLKLSEEIKTDFKFDYVLVVDTEGLRALELEGQNTLHHDNELATFVVGLGNMTLINIFGENPAEMQDILQIVVQAFMRMKKVQLSPSCVFVHQNVTDITAAEKNMDGKRRLQEKLDKITQLAAKEEGCEAECFSEVIAFDVQKDVKYFAQLWEGSPPMAPPNPGYSESVQELKSFILSKASESDGIKLSHFSSKIQDLWNALMNENFVFSFKNTQEISMYRKLEVQYGNWTWTLRSEMLTIENRLYPQIEKRKIDKIEISDLSKEINKTYEGINKEIRNYFEKDADKEMLVQWRGRFENKIKDFHEELLTGVKRKLDEVIQQKKACKKLDEKKTDFENKLLQKSKELAHTLRETMKDEEELKMQFDSVWSHWVKELTSDTKPIEDINLEEDQLTVLKDLGFEWNLCHKLKHSKQYKILPETGNYFDYVNLKKYHTINAALKYIGVEPLSHEDQEQIRSFIKNVEQKSLEIIQSKPVETRGFTPTYLHEVAKTVQENVTEFESKIEFTFKKEFRIELLLFVFHQAADWILQSHKTYKDNNDALIYLNSKKNEYFNIFRSFCKGSSSAVVFGEMICEKLKVSAVEAVCNQTAVDLAGELRCNVPAFNGNRLNLEKHVLKDLAEKEDFNKFITYIRDPREQVEEFIREKVKKYMFEENKNKAPQILQKNSDDIQRFIRQTLFEATEKIKTEKGDINMWVKEFSSSLSCKLTVDTISCQNFSDINNFDFLNDEIEKGLQIITKEMKNLSLTEVINNRQKPDEILIDQLCNCCWEQCPFCAAVCINTIKDHSPDKHSVLFHRPGGVKGWDYRDTAELVTDFCTTSVTSDQSFYPSPESEKSIPYKRYQTAGGEYASWSITADGSMLPYWKWFVCRFQKEIEDYYKKKFQDRGEIPSEWRNYSKEEALRSLDEMCSL